MNPWKLTALMAAASANTPVLIDRGGRHRDTHKLRTTDMVRKANRKRNKASRAANAKRLRMSK